MFQPNVCPASWGPRDTLDLPAERARTDAGSARKRADKRRDSAQKRLINMYSAKTLGTNEVETMSSLEEARSAEKAFLDALATLPNDVEGVCAVTLTDPRDLSVIATAQVSDPAVVAQCLTAITVNALHNLHMSVPEAIHLLAYIVFDTMARYEIMAGGEGSSTFDSGELGASVTVKLFASLMNLSPNTAGYARPHSPDRRKSLEAPL